MAAPAAMPKGAIYVTPTNDLRQSLDRDGYRHGGRRRRCRHSRHTGRQQGPLASPLVAASQRLGLPPRHESARRGTPRERCHRCQLRVRLPYTFTLEYTDNTFLSFHSASAAVVLVQPPSGLPSMPRSFP